MGNAFGYTCNRHSRGTNRLHDNSTRCSFAKAHVKTGFRRIRHTADNRAQLLVHLIGNPVGTSAVIMSVASQRVNDSIHNAAQRCDLEAICRFLEVDGVDVNCRDERGNTPLISAIRLLTHKSSLILPVISYLLSKNANVEATVREDGHWLFGCTSLMIASGCGNVEAVKIILEQGCANVNYSVPGSGESALIRATSNRYGHTVVPTLLQHGADLSSHAKLVPSSFACLHVYKCRQGC